MFSEYSIESRYAARTSRGRSTRSGARRPPAWGGRPSRRRPGSSRPVEGGAPTGAWLEMRSISAMTGGRPALRELEALRTPSRAYWSGIGGEAELRAGVAEVARVVDPVEVVEARPRASPVVRGHDGHRAPARRA